VRPSTSVHTLRIQIWPSRAPSKVKTTENRARDALLALGGVFPIFPSPLGCANHGAKVAFNETLEAISKAMGMCRPKTERLVNVEEPPYGWVLKREFSDTGKDVYIPTPKSGPLRRAENRKAATFIKERTDKHENDECSWLAQELAPFLPIAEIRFLCVGGVPVREVVTGKHSDNHPSEPGGMWSYERNESLKTISALQ
jgi:hypothetical protein